MAKRTPDTATESPIVADDGAAMKRRLEARRAVEVLKDFVHCDAVRRHRWP